MSDSGNESRSSQSAHGFRQDESAQMEAMLAQPLPAARSDLKISPQLYLGKTVYIVKDPVSLQYFRLQPAEHFVLRNLDGRTSAGELAERVNARFPEQPTTAEEVFDFVRMLQGTALLLGRGESHGQWLRKNQRLRRRKRSIAQWTNFLFIKIPVLDPDRLLDHLYSYARLVMNKPMLVLSSLFMIVAAAAALLEMHRVTDLAMPVLGWTNLMLMGAVFIVVKMIHEFGHGLAAKHHGLEVHEMGVLLMVFFPLLYVDTSDAWMVPRRRDRLWITAGGVFIEFLFAAVAVFVWLNTEPGVVNQVAFNIMLAASVTTLLFNANPLLRYDGYYFLMDVLQIPNLRAKSTQYLAYLAKRYILAMPDQEPPREAATHPILMPIYAVAASVYRVIIVFSIVALVWHILDPYGLEVLGSLLGSAAIFLMVVMPLLKILRFLWIQQAKTWRRMAATAVAVVALGLVGWGILSIPLKQTVEQPAVVLAPHRQPIYTAAAGRVEEVLAQAGQTVEAGEPILRLRKDDLEDRLERLKIQRRSTELEREIARQMERLATARAREDRLKQIEKQIEHVRQQIEKRTVRAPITGRLQVGKRLQALLGAHVEPGKRLGRLIGAGDRHVVMVMPQGDAAILRRGMHARVRLWGAGTPTLEGRVDRIGHRFLDTLPHRALSSRFKGEVDTKPQGDYKSKPSKPSVKVRVTLADKINQSAGLADGMTGRGKVVVGTSTLGHQQWRTIRQAMSLDWWL